MHFFEHIFVYDNTFCFFCRFSIKPSLARVFEDGHLAEILLLSNNIKNFGIVLFVLGDLDFALKLKSLTEKII